ncbi:MAG: ABC transporter permease [Epulopiscium sp. Nele67-Bin004]|nr:MAG: ABC transporter permease [Epulopiscium sp. Nele67-Bin004]
MTTKTITKEKPKFNTKYLINKSKSILLNPYHLIICCIIILLGYLIVIPLGEMFQTSLILSAQDARRVEGAVAGDFSTYYWERVLASGQISAKLLYEPLLNSLMIATCVSIGSIIIGGGLAWFMTRTNLPFKKFFAIAVVIPYMIPSWCKAQAWITVFKNERIGGSTGFLASFGVNVPDWLAYGPIAIIIVLILHNYTYSYLLVSGALKSVNSELEEIAQIQGAPRGTILRKVTLPIIMPAILSSIILTFSDTIGTFSAINILGGKIGYTTLSTMLYSNSRSQNTEVAFVMAIIMILIASLLILINQKMIGSRKSFATIGGKGSRHTLVDLGKFKYLIAISIMLFLGIGIMMPLLILVVETFMLREGVWTLDNFTLYYWIGDGSITSIMEGLPGILRNPKFISALKNSLLLTFITATVGTIVGQLIGYVCARGRGKRYGQFIEQLAFVPYLIPSVAFGAIYLSMFAVQRGIIPSLYGTFSLLALVCIVKDLPFATRAGTSNMLQISYELEEAGTIVGAGFFKRIRKIVFPLSKNGFMSGFILIFISAMKELDLIILVMTPQNTTLPYLAYQYANGNSPQASNACVVVMFVIIFTVYLLANKLGKADLAQGIGKS